MRVGLTQSAEGLKRKNADLLRVRSDFPLLRLHLQQWFFLACQQTAFGPKLQLFPDFTICRPLPLDCGLAKPPHSRDPIP